MLGVGSVYKSTQREKRQSFCTLETIPKIRRLDVSQQALVLKLQCTLALAKRTTVLTSLAEDSAILSLLAPITEGSQETESIPFDNGPLWSSSSSSSSPSSSSSSEAPCKRKSAVFAETNPWNVTPTWCLIRRIVLAWTFACFWCETGMKAATCCHREKTTMMMDHDVVSNKALLLLIIIILCDCCFSVVRNRTVIRWTDTPTVQRKNRFCGSDQGPEW